VPPILRQNWTGERLWRRQPHCESPYFTSD